MAKGNQKYEREATEREQARSQGEYDSFLNQFLDRKGTPNSVVAGTADAKSKSGIMSALGQRGRTPGAPVVGQAGGRNESTESQRYTDLKSQGDEERDYMRSGLRGMAEGGGIDQGGIDDFRSRYQGALGSANQAKLSDFTEERGRYRDFADTGGYSAGDIQRVQAQAARSAPSFYNSLRDQQGIAASRMGANAGAGAGLDLKLARQAAQGSAADKLNANIGLAESQRAGKQFGIGGLESTQTEMGRQSLEQAGMNNQFQLGAGGITADAERGIADLKQKGQIAGYGGLMDLYGSNYAPQSDFEKTWLSAVGDSSKSTQGNRGLQLQNDEVNRSKMMENITGLVGAAAGGITGMGAIGGALGGIMGGAKGGQGAGAGQMGQGFQGALGQNPWGASQFSQQPNYGMAQNTGMFGAQPTQQRRLQGLRF